MFLLQRNSLVTIAPKFSHDLGEGARFRWTMHVSLPFPFPSSSPCIQEPHIDGLVYSFAIHNQTDRLIISDKNCVGRDRTVLHPRSTPIPDIGDDCQIDRQMLQSVAVFTEHREVTTPNDAFENASEKIQACFAHLSGYLAKLQTEIPFLAAWLLYPISLFDVGTVFHSVEKYCDQHETWHTFASAPAISMARSLQNPLFVLRDNDVNSKDRDSIPILDVAHELLAEALMSLFRGMTRLTILNSYLSIESLANSIFSMLHIKMLVENNVPHDLASKLTEDKRQRHKTDPNFLLHRGLKDSGNRSLIEENKEMYDNILDLHKMRHKVAHAGEKPDVDYAREAHALACECIRWLTELAGMPTKPMLPPHDSVIQGITTTAQDAHAISVPEHEFIRRALGYSDPSSSENAE